MPTSTFAQFRRVSTYCDAFAYATWLQILHKVKCISQYHLRLVIVNGLVVGEIRGTSMVRPRGEMWPLLALLLVVLHDRSGAHFGFVRILAGVTSRAPLS